MLGGKDLRGGQSSSPHRNRRRLPAERNSLRRKNVERSSRFCRTRGNATDRASLEAWSDSLAFFTIPWFGFGREANAALASAGLGTSHGCHGRQHVSEN